MRTASRTSFGTALLLATVAVGVFTTGASAQPDPDPGDPRATAVAGNVDIGQPGDACDVVGLPGNESTMPPGTFTNDGTFIDISAYPPGTVVTGVVVKGGPAYNIYPAGNLGALPWQLLHSPLNASGKPAEISHWFVCVDVPATTTTTTATTITTTSGTTTSVPTTTVPTTTTSPGVTTTKPAVTTTTKPAVATTTTTKQAPVAVPGSDDDLAATGFDALWLLLGGSALVAAGAAALLAAKLRRRSRS